MKRIVGFIAALVLMLTLLPFQQAEAAEVNKHYTVNVKKLDVREKPTPKAKVVGSLKNGKVVFVYNTEPGGWSKIKYNGKAGYVASSGFKKAGDTTKPSPPAEPVLMKDIKHGMTYEQVKKKETRPLITDVYYPDMALLTYAVTKYGYNANLEYLFENNRLQYVTYNFLPSEDDYHTRDELAGIHNVLQIEAIKEFGDVYFYYDKEYPNSFNSSWIKPGYWVLLTVNDNELYSRAEITFYEGTIGAASNKQSGKLDVLMNELDRRKMELQNSH